MTNKLFDYFINQRSKLENKDEIDWNARLEEWKKYLSDFHHQIENFLKPYTESEKLTITKRAVSLHEEYIGSYEVNALDIQLGYDKIMLTPIGTNLIGVKGRVDMLGPRGTIQFVLVPKGSSSPRVNVKIRDQSEEKFPEDKTVLTTEWEWKISTPPPRINYLELEEESFQAAMMEVVNG